MAILKCKMCGGDLILLPDTTVCECDYCGTKQTVPNADNEKKITLFSRANRLRFACEFDKAAGVYEAIVADFPEEPEAYWGLVLCKYGIEYVDDPAAAKKIPTCHRSSFESVMDDPNFEMTLEYADVVARGVYRDEAKQIETLRKGIIEVSSKEEPYDIFICYKETDENGDRTIDSVIAQDVYTELVALGYKVFFSRITLEDKLGQEYEPYIFAALNSAKIMLAFGTDYEYYNAVWVKNEWSRFLQLMAKGEKKTLIPCYKGIDAYDMPKEFAKLQAQDMGKVGAMQDLLRGIEKMLPKKQDVTKAVDNSSGATNKTERLLEKAATHMKLDNYSEALSIYKTITDDYPEDHRGWWGLIICETHNFTDNTLVDLPHKWFGYVKQLADQESFKPLEAQYLKYINAVSHSAVIHRIANITKNINALKNKINDTNRNIDKTTIDKAARAGLFEKDSESITKSIKAYERAVKVAKTKRTIFQSIFIAVIVLAGIGIIASLASSDIVASIFCVALFSIPFRFTLSWYNNAKNTFYLMQSNLAQSINNLHQTQAQFERENAALTKKIYNANNSVIENKKNLQKYQNHLALGEEKLRKMWIFEQCKIVGIESPVAE